MENPLCSTCRQRHADMKRRVVQAHGNGSRRAGPPLPSWESDQAFLDRMRPALRKIDAAHLDTLLWKQCSSGADLCELGKVVLAQGNQASLALRKVSCATAPALGSECPRAAEASLRARVSRLVLALPEASRTVHQLTEYSDEEDQWLAVAGLVAHYRGQLRLVDEPQWKLFDINGNMESATDQLVKLHPTLMRKDALVTVGNSYERIGNFPPWLYLESSSSLAYPA